jgi:hypothetical protein
MKDVNLLEGHMIGDHLVVKNMFLTVFAYDIKYTYHVIG